MTTVSSHRDLISFLSELKEEEVLREVRRLVKKKEPPLLILESCQEALNYVGLNFERGHYYLSGLMMAGEIMRRVSEMLQLVLEKSISGEFSGRVLIGTVQGDIHDIGKNLVGVIMRCHGFEVTDLGVDVSPGDFLKAARKYKPHVVGLSGLLTVSFESMKETVTVLRRDGQKRGKAVPIIIGGSLINEKIRQYVDSDCWAPDAMTGAKICEELVGPRP